MSRSVEKGGEVQKGEDTCRRRVWFCPRAQRKYAPGWRETLDCDGPEVNTPERQTKMTLPLV